MIISDKTIEPYFISVEKNQYVLKEHKLGGSKKGQSFKG